MARKKSKNRGKKVRLSTKFHRKIERLLRNGGFDITESNLHRPGADIVAEAEGKKLIIQCKRAEKEGKIYRRIGSLKDEYATKRRRSKASRAILALSRYRLPEKYSKSEVLDTILRKDKVVIWTDDIVSYYSRVVRATREYSKFSMFVDWNISDVFGKPVEVPAIRCEQKAFDLFVFSISPEILLKMAYVSRRLYDSKGYQRIVNVNRLSSGKKDSIADYLDSQEGIFPTNLVCAFYGDVTYSKRRGVLKIPCKYGSIWLIDGQHRLYGFCHAKKRHMKRYRLICCGFNVRNMIKSHIDKHQQAKLFVTVNQTAQNVTTNLLLELYEMIGKKDRRVEVVKCLAREPIFRSRIRTIGKKGSISMATFALTPAMANLVDDKGEISRWIGKSRQRKRVRTADCVSVLKRYFKLIAKACREWKKPDVYMLSTDRGIRALLRLCPDVLEYSNGLRSPSKAIGIFRALRKHAQLENMLLKGQYYGEGGADALLQEWIVAIQKERSDFGPQPEIKGSLSVRDGELSSAKSFLQKCFSQFTGEVRGTILYVDETTCEYLEYIPNDCVIKLIITTTKGDKGKCISNLAQVLDKHPEAGIRAIFREYGQGQRANLFHQRWIADGNRKIYLDQDLKHDAQGKRHTIKVFDRPHLDPEYRDFKDYWSASTDKLGKLLGRKTRAEVVYPC